MWTSCCSRPPPAFRPLHIAAAIDAGKHVFAEKPVAVDATGVRSVLASAAKAKEKGLSLASGFCWRAHGPKRAVYEQIHSGRIGAIKFIHANYLTGELWKKERQPEWTDMEDQLRNWLYYYQLSGDFIVEQACHSIDKIMWAKQDAVPATITAMGGRQVRTAERFGNVYDHFGVHYQWADGSEALLQCRQMPGCTNENKDRVVGSKGTAHIDGWANRMVIDGEDPWRWRGESKGMYQLEHDEFFADIRGGGGMLNQGESMAHSTLAAIAGRMSAYTGQRLTWEQVLHSEEDLSPPEWAYGPGWEVEVPTPGQTKFV